MTGWMLFLPSGKPLNCVGAWRIFTTKQSALIYAAGLEDSGVVAQKVKVERITAPPKP